MTNYRETEGAVQNGSPAHTDTSGEEALGFVHRWVPRPAAALTLLLLHGTGGDEDDLIPLGQALAPDAALLSVRGRVLENGMPRFFRRLAEGVFDQADLARRTGELRAFLAAAAAHYGFDPTTVVAVGYSNGANLAASLLLRYPHTLHRALLFRAMVPFTPAAPPELAGTDVLLCAGRRDAIVPPAQPGALAALLRAGGAAVILQWQDAGHGLVDGDLRAARLWLAHAAEKHEGHNA
jgi:predicted esterase